MDLSVMHSSAEAITCQVNWLNILATIAIQNNNFQNLRDQNDYGGKAAVFGAKALENSDLQQADMYYQDFIQATSAACGTVATYAVAYSYANKVYNKQIEAAQEKVDVADTYLSEATQSIGESSANARARLGQNAPQAQDEARLVQNMKNNMKGQDLRFDENQDLVERNNIANGRKYKLTTDARNALDVSSEEDKIEIRDGAAKAKKAAVKELEQAQQGKQMITGTYAQLINGLITNVTQAAQNNIKAQDQTEKAYADYLQALMTWIGQAFQLSNQITTTAMGLQNERLSSIINTMNTETQANKGQ